MRISSVRGIAAWWLGGGVGLCLLAGLLTSCRVGTSPVHPRARDSGLAVSNWQREVDRWLGSPYRWGGTTPRGVDCSGFVQQVYGRVTEVRLPRTTREQIHVGVPVSRRSLQPGDLVFFNTTGGGVSHVGLAMGGDRFAHASQTRGVTYSRLSEPYWDRRYLGARRVVHRRAKTLTPRKRCQQTRQRVCGVTHL